MMIKSLEFRVASSYSTRDPNDYSKIVWHSRIDLYRLLPDPNASFEDLLIGASEYIDDYGAYGVVIRTDGQSIGVTKDGEVYYVQY